MRINAIIAEYNPFHNGHKYQLETSKTLTDADYTIIAMSGNFMQRGTPAMIHKYARAEMALRNGADLVLEIPSCYACSSAEYYAHGAVSMLDRLGVVDTLSFGSECGDEAMLRSIAQVLAAEPAAFREQLSERLRQGQSYPAARAGALLEYLDSSVTIADIINSPNNLLGIEYLKAIIRRGSPIKAVTVKRIGSGYHEEELGKEYPSATAIRNAVLEGKDFPSLEQHVPENTLGILSNTTETTKPVQTEDFSQILLYRLLSQSCGQYDQYLDVTPDLSDKIKNAVFQFGSFESFCDLLKSKDLTHTRIRRGLLHILLDIKDSDMEMGKSLDYVPYARVLGLRKDAAPLLSAIKESSDIPMITKLADAEKILSADALQMLRQDIRISHIYNAVEACKSGTEVRNEYRTPIVVL